MAAPTDRGLIALLGALACVLASACSSDPKPLCTTVDTKCTSAYEPTFDQIFTNTLKPTCGKSGVSCHGSPGRQHDLVFEDADTAYRLLNEQGLVHGGDTSCSRVVVNVTSDDPFVRMPPAKAISKGEQCAIIQWVANGALR